jgi:flavin reductase (DIM6/NTAB) family NADH-FMN oxidoreductase RutF
MMPPMPETPVFDPRDFRNALGCYPTGVTVVTTLDRSGEPRGFTANSFTSVSLDPPLLLICVAKSAHSHSVFSEANVFSVNVLSDQQRDVSGLFASKTADKFEKAAWSKSVLQTPTIHGSLASFHCTTAQHIDAGDHTILLGHVKSFSTADGTPLGYCRGAYVTYQNAVEVEAAVRGGARVGAIIETPQGVLMIKSGNTLNLPSANKLGTPGGATGLHKLLREMCVDVTLDFVFSVYEDANGPCVIYRGRATNALAPAPDAAYVKFEDLAELTHTDTTTLSILKRFARERSQDIYSIYVGDDQHGVVVALKTN